MLLISPISPFTTVGGQVPVGCVAGNGAGGGFGTLVRPAAYTIQWSLAGQGGTLGPFTRGDKQDPPANMTLGFAPNLPDGDYCVNLQMTLVPGSGVVAVGAQQFTVPPRPSSVQRQICFIKMSSRPSANVTFNSCNSSFGVDLTGVRPKPIFLRFPDMQMFSTVFHVWGKLNRTFDRGEQAEGLLDYFDQYVKWEDPQRPAALKVHLEDPGLIQGYYNVWIEGSLSSQFPDLVNLFGADTFDDGSAKFMGVSLRNTSNKPVPIQTTKSKIANLEGPSTPVGVGEMASFVWETEGYGEQFCYVDGQKVANAADRAHCESPLTLRVVDGGNHTLEVALADVCGDVVRNGLYFGAWGWRLDQKYLPKPEPGAILDTLPLGNDALGAGLPLPMRAPIARRPRNGAEALAAGAGTALAGLLVGAAALLI